MKRFAYAAIAALAVGVLSAGSANATIIILDVANANLATQGAGPYGQFDITGSGTSYHVVATGLNGFVFGDGNIADLNLSAAAGAGTLTAGSGTIPLTQQAGGGQVDGFGNFNFVLDDGPGFSTPHPTFSFDFTTANSVTLATLLAPNNQGAEAAGHLALATNTACTGFAADAGTSSGGVDNSACTSTRVPEPASLAIFGTALAGLGLLGRRRKRLV